jgi:hypothetical protein
MNLTEESSTKHEEGEVFKAMGVEHHGLDLFRKGGWKLTDARFFPLIRGASVRIFNLPAEN